MSNALERAEAQLRELSAQRDAMRAQWDELMAELGNPSLPTETDLEQMIEALPARDRAELRRFRDETHFLTSTITHPTTQPMPARTENLRIHRLTIRG